MVTTAVSGDMMWDAAYSYLVAIYPPRKPSPTESAAYRSALSAVDPRFVSQAVAGAPATWPKYFPSAGELLAESMRHQRASASSSAPKPEAAPYVPPKLREDNPFELLARKWERESADLGLLPGAVTPSKIARERAIEIQALFERHAIGVAA